VDNKGSFVIRHAVAADRTEMVRVLRTAFSDGSGPTVDFLRLYPHLFHESRIANHFVRVEEGRIIGVVGLYPYRVRMAGVEFAAAGVGQVATLPKYRGRGVMASLLRRACQETDARGCDFVWLGGDRLRYGRYGWATGGVKLRFGLKSRYLPEPPPERDVSPFDPDRDLHLVQRQLSEEPSTILTNDAELRRILDASGVGGWRMGDAFILHRRGPGLICLGGGPPERIARLFAHHLREICRTESDRQGITAECSGAPTPFLSACQRSYAGMSLVPAGMFRVGRLAPFLQKACRIAQPRVRGGSGGVSLVNTDSGDGATVLCRHGRLSVHDRADGDAYRLTWRDLSEVCFGLCPLDTLLPALPEDSFLRTVLPIPAFWPPLFGL